MNAYINWAKWKMANFARLSTVQYQDLCDDRGTLIRLWLSARSAHRTSPQKIGCINVVPRIKITNREHINGEEITQIHNINCEEELPSEKWSLENSRPEYECLDEMLERLNELLENKPIMGNKSIISLPDQSNHRICSSKFRQNSQCRDRSDSGRRLVSGHRDLLLVRPEPAKQQHCLHFAGLLRVRQLFAGTHRSHRFRASGPRVGHTIGCSHIRNIFQVWLVST